MLGSGILLLSNNANSWGLFEWLSDRGVPAVLYCGKVSTDFLAKIDPRLVVSYNYRHIIKPDVIDYMQGKIVNLHISLLPWNRGSSPNFWSFVDDTPKGVTIHRVTQGLDTGDIIAQREVFFDENKETFSSSYDRLQTEIVELFKENWQELYEGTYTLHQQQGIGSYHTQRDRQEYLLGKNFSYDMKIYDFKEQR